MSDRFAERLLRALRDAYPADRAYRRSHLVHTDGPLPDAVAHFLIHDLWMRARDHVDRIASDPWIDGSHESVQNALDDLQNRLSEAVQFPAEAWEERLGEAVERVCGYVRDPVGELTEYVFENASTLPVETVLRRMGYFRPYPYFEDVLEAYLERKSIKILDRDRFETVLRRIDRELASDYGAEQWNRLFDPVFTLAEPLGASDRPVRVPASVLQEAASARGFTELAESLEETEGRALTRDEFETTVETVLRGEPDPSQPEETGGPDGAAKEPKGSAPPPSEATERAASGSEATDADAEDDDGPRPRWKKFQRPGSNRSGEVTRERETAEADAEEDAPLWKKFQRPTPAKGRPRGSREPDDTPADRRSSGSPSGDGGPSTAEPNPLDQLEEEIIGTIPSDQRRRFIDKLFGGSTDKYHQTLRRLEQVGSWQQASSLIAEEVFIPHKVDIYSEPAVTFTDLVEARYREETAS